MGFDSRYGLFAHGFLHPSCTILTSLCGPAGYLAKWIGAPGNAKSAAKLKCKHCKGRNHITDDCRYLGKTKCPTCDKFGHAPKDCWFKDQPRKRKNDEDTAHPAKRPRNETVNVAVEEQKAPAPQKPITFAAIEEVVENSAMTDRVDDGENEVAIVCDENEDISLGGYGMYEYAGMNPEIQMCDWIADSATTAHVANNRALFTEYVETPNASVTGVGGIRTNIQGKGTVILESGYKGSTYILRLKDVLHIPANKNNLISLGRWDDAGGTYKSDARTLKLTMKGGTVVAEGHKVHNHLYRMRVKAHEHIKGKHETHLAQYRYQTFLSEEPTQSWEVWHKRFGHVSYSGLQTLLEKGLVIGFTVNTRTPKPDCVACTEAKLTEEPYNKKVERQTKPGELTHMDLWGKYDIMSINGHQYYALFVDDASRYITLHFLKRKDEATQAVKNYLTHLSTHGRTPRAMRTDRGKEYVNEPLQTWCRERGIDTQLTAPYSPSQNGIAERANRTLVELARAMITAQKVPEFLWEHAIAHAAYI